MNEPTVSNHYLGRHAQLLFSSYYHLLGKEISEFMEADMDPYRALYRAPFGIVSHGTEQDPIFNYANRTAQKLFEMDWRTFTQLPSRKSAEPVDREERQGLLDRVSQNGYIDHYQGVRISSTGKRFRIENAVVWNLSDDRGIYRGQAALFHHWLML